MVVVIHITMPVHFDEGVSHHLSLFRTIGVSEKDRTVLIPLKEMIESQRGAFLAVTKLQVHVKESLHLQWTTRWKHRKRLVPALISGEWTGITGLTPGFDSDTLSATLRDNVLAYSFSVLRKMIDPIVFPINNSSGKDYEIKTFFMDRHLRSEGVECMLLSLIHI